MLIVMNKSEKKGKVKKELVDFVSWLEVN